MRRYRGLVFVALTVLLVSAAPPTSLGAGADAPAHVVVMTRNCYFGADLNPAIYALVYAPDSVPQTLATIWANVQKTDIPARAKLLADEITANQPDLVGLQEVAVWRTAATDGKRVPDAAHVEFDMLKLILRALAARGQRYRAVVLDTAGDFEDARALDGGGTQDTRLTIRDVVLARRGVKTSRPQAGTFANALVLPFRQGAAPVARGWCAVDAVVRGSKFRFVACHLEDNYDFIQRAQVRELLDGACRTELPTIFLGDFNSDPGPADPSEPPPACDPTNTNVAPYSPGAFFTIVGDGFTDAWDAVHPNDVAHLGRTYGPCNDLLDNRDHPWTTRIDHVFLRGGTTATDAVLVGKNPAEAFKTGLWPSDHAGLVVGVDVPAVAATAR